MADKENNVPSNFQDFYLFDRSVADFASLLAEHLDPIILDQNLGISSPTTQIDTFSEDTNISSDGGAVTVESGDISVETYLHNNAAFAHEFYDEVTHHYELREEGYWSADGLIEIIGESLEQLDVKYPYELSFREYLTAHYRPGWEVDSEEEPIEVRIQERLKQNEDDINALDRDLKRYFRTHEIGPPPIDTIREVQGSDRWPPDDRVAEVFEANARHIVPEDIDTSEYEKAEPIPIKENSIDLILTSPPYWKKRKYFDDDEVELGQEPDVKDYVENLVDALERWKRFLRPTGSVFLNIGDTFRNKSLQGVPGLFANEAQDRGWTIRNEIIWTKPNGVPSPVSDRLVSRHEQIFHLVQNDDYFYDREGYIDIYDTGSNPDDVWRVGHDRNTGGHLAPFPDDLVHRAMTLACPPTVCDACGTPHRRITNKDKDELLSGDSPESLVNHLIEYEYYKLNPRRSQAQRAIKRFIESDLTFTHIRAMQAVGISDAGKAIEFQKGAGMNDKTIQQAADEAKEVMRGYFREFTFPQRQTVAWSSCDCDDETRVPGRVFDPFAGSGTTLEVAKQLGYDAYGVDLDTSHWEEKKDNS